MSLTLTKIAETGATITLGWTAPPDAQVYVFYAGGKRVSTGTAFYASGAHKGQPREQVQFGKTGEPYEVAALCRDAAGVFRVELGSYPSATPPPAVAPAIPTGLAAAVSANAVTLAWNPNAPADQVDVYQVYMDDQEVALDVPGTSYVIPGLAQGSTHAFRVSAHNAVGYGEWSSAVSVTLPGGTPDYTYRFATFDPTTDKVTGCLNRFPPTYSWWVPGSPEGSPWPKGGGIKPVSHPTYGPGLDMIVTDEMLYGNASTGPKDSNIVRFVGEPRLIDERLRVPTPGSIHTWECTIMRPSGFTWPNDQYESVWEQGTDNGFGSNVGHHIYLQKDYHWPGFSYYFGRQNGAGPLGGVYWQRYNCPTPFNADEHHSLRWELLWSGIGVANGYVKAWTSVNGGPEQQWLNVLNVPTLVSGFRQHYNQMMGIRTDLARPPQSFRIHNLRVLIS